MPTLEIDCVEFCKALADETRQGILKQRCPSPNPALTHVPLVGRADDVRNVTVHDVELAVTNALARDAPPPPGSRSHAVSR